jgi:hypothetical protein
MYHPVALVDRGYLDDQEGLVYRDGLIVKHYRLKG